MSLLHFQNTNAIGKGAKPHKEHKLGAHLRVLYREPIGI